MSTPISPTSTLYLCNVPIQPDYKHQLKFASRTSQEAYFKNKLMFNFSNEKYVYLKQDKGIKVSANIDTIINANYLYYQNSGFTNKYYYAFITKMEYINPNTTMIYIETDVFQTWQFDLKYNRCFVEREMVSDDTPGLNTVPEGLETGEYVTNNETKLEIFGPCIPCLAVTELIGVEEADYYKYNGIMSGNIYIISDSDEHMSNIIRTYAKLGKSSAITSMFMIPEVFKDYADMMTVPGYTYVVTYGIIKSFNEPWGATTLNFDKPTTVNDYVPENNKLLTYPYSYLNIDNNVGNCTSLRYEFFYSRDVYAFEFDLGLSPGCNGKIRPVNYNNLTLNNHYSFNATKLPICSFQNDVYKNWLTQNGLNIGLGVINGAAQIIGGVALASTGAGALTGVGAVGSGLSTIANTLSSDYQHSLTPPSLEGNINGADISYALGLHDPIMYQMSIRQEYAKIIDEYFSMFGYKVNRVKIPNINNRPNWNFIKTIDCNVTGTIPKDDLAIIRQMFDNGVTLWHNVYSVYNYNISNK